MLHGIIKADWANQLKTDPNNDFQSEIRSFFASGTQLQELYISPHLMTEADWDDIAESAKWAHAHADVLVDSRLGRR
jgi:hypothetical protein